MTDSCGTPLATLWANSGTDAPDWWLHPRHTRVASAGWLLGGACQLAVADSAAIARLATLDSKARQRRLRESTRQGLRAVACAPQDAARMAAWLQDALDVPPAPGGGDNGMDVRAERTATVGLAVVGTPLPGLLLRLREQLMWMQAPCTSFYGGLLQVFGLGILIRGPAAIGKSELALELLTRGHRLVADDVVELRRLPGGFLVGSAPPLLQGFLEVRGLGVLEVAPMFGPEALCSDCRVDAVIQLQPQESVPIDYRARLHGLRRSEAILGQRLPGICLPVRVGHNLATLVETACRDLALRRKGHRADERFAARQQAAIDAQT